MLKLIVGLKGSGKTKTLIQMANEKTDLTNGSVVCIEKGTKLIHEIKHQARLMNIEDYNIQNADEMFGFIAGICASNHDVADIFIDSALKICNQDIASFDKLISGIAAFAEAHEINFVITSSMTYEDVPEGLRKFI